MPDLADLARRDAVVTAAAGWETLTVTGPDRAKWLEGLVTCAVAEVTPGTGNWGLALNRLGKIQSALWLLAARAPASQAEALWLAAAPGTVDALFRELGRMLIMEDAELERPAVAQRWFAFHGPLASARAAELASRLQGHSGSIDWTGLGGAALVVPEELAPDVVEACRERWLEPEAWTLLRIERGLGEFGVDYTEQERPHEAALDRRAVNWAKGCYLGQEVVCMQDMRGKVKRRLELLDIDAPAHAKLESGASISTDAGQAIGKVTSLAFSERAGRWRALAKLDLSAAEGPLQCRSGDEAWPAAIGVPA